MESKAKIKRVAGVHRWWMEVLRVGVPISFLIVGAFAFTWYFVQPAPPNHVVIAAGARDGMYYAMASKYAEYFAANGITLEVRPTEGTGENYKLLEQPDSGVDVAIVQGGASPPAALRPHIQAVAGIYYEPVMVFVRGDRLTQLSQLAGKRIAIGADGSGVRLLASMLLDEAGVTDHTAGTQLLDLGSDPAADELASGQIDAAFFVMAPDVPVVTRLFSTPGIHLMSFDQAHAYGRRHAFLSATTLFEGAVDIKKNLPDSDIQLVAAPATIAVRSTTHSAVIELLVRAAQEYNSPTTLLASANTFPNVDAAELPLNRDARYFLKNPPSILHRTLPFWLASMIDRLMIMVLPLLVVLIPLSRLMPSALRWRVQRPLLQHYKLVRILEDKLDSNSSPADLRAGREKLLAMEMELATIRLPVSYAKDLYNLRLHIFFVRERFEGWLNPEPAVAVGGN